tara:strand:+ start:253 stop:1218 length:966 start_codon:yes stop_codon:yes gene_type:complete
MIDNLRKRYEQLQGLLDKGMTEQGGLLNNIPQGAVLGSAIYGQGIKGKDPFESLLPAFAQTAQIQKLLTPKTGALKQAYDPNKVNEDGSKGGVVYASDKEIRAKGLTPALPQKNITTMPGGGLSITESYGSGGTKTGDSKEIKQANELYNTTFQMNNVANNLVDSLKQSKVGAVGSTINALDSLGSQIGQVAESFGVSKNFEDKGTGAIDKVMQKNFNLSKEAVNYGKVKSASINLAYLMARVDEPGGRFTDRDIALKMEEIGLGSNPQKTIEILNNAVQLRNKNASFAYKTLTGKDMPSFDILDEEEDKKKTVDPLNLGF